MKTLLVTITMLPLAAIACGNECGIHATPNIVTGPHIGPTATAGPATATGGQSSAIAGPSSATTGPVSTTVSDGGNSSRAWALGLAPIAKTPPMAHIACSGATVKQESVGIVFGLFSHASGTSDGSDCTLINLRNAKIDACQYASAKMIEDQLAKKHLPNYEASTTSAVDLTPDQCALVKNPPREVVREVIKEVPAPAKDPCLELGWKRNNKGVCYNPTVRRNPAPALFAPQGQKYEMWLSPALR